MDIRLTYLQRYPSATGRSCLGGRRLFDTFRREFADVRLAYSVAKRDDIARIKHEAARSDFVPEEDFVVEGGSQCLYVEGGLVESLSTWRLQEDFLVPFVSSGGLAIVADVDRNAFTRWKADYSAASEFLGARADYGPRDDSVPIYGRDETTGYGGGASFKCYPEKMGISDWLRPVYEGVDYITVSGPVLLHVDEEILASGNGDSSGTLLMDVWVDRRDAFPFASVKRHGLGHVVYIAASVSDDVITMDGRNTQWLTNTVEFLLQESAAERARRESLTKARNVLFLSHRSIDSPVVAAVAKELRVLGIRPWLDRDELALSDSITQAISQAMDEMTGFVLFWSKDCVGAPWVERELYAANARLVEQNIPIFVVTLDPTPVPSLIRDLRKLDAARMDAMQVAAELERAVARVRARRS